MNSSTHLIGRLASGIHRMGLVEFERRFCWNAHRQWLGKGLFRAVDQLARAGCRSILIDGSFVSEKEHPSDWDAAFDPVGVDPIKLDPVLLRHTDRRLSMKAKYLGDLFPWNTPAAGLGGPVYFDFFQTDRNGAAKGVVLMNIESAA